MSDFSADSPRPVGGGAGFQFRPMDSAAFASKAYPLDWLVQDVLVAGQPGVIGGPKKALKTSLAVDLAVSLASGTPFLSRFAVPRKVRVAVFSGESGAATLKDAASRVCQARGLTLEGCDALWEPEQLPRLSDAGDRDELRRGLAEAGVRLVVIDPLYLCLGGGGERIAASNLYEVGPALHQAARACLDAGATPLFVHHANKSAGKKTDPAEPPDLDDLAFSGIGEFVRQWLLLGRRAPYRPGSGRHELVLHIGGSAGHSGLWQLDVDEGVGATGRRWEVRVSAAEATPAKGTPSARTKAGSATRGSPAGFRPPVGPFGR